MESILQFGVGRFLRAFADFFAHEAAASGHPVGRIVAVQSTAGDRAGGLARQGYRYHVAVRGMTHGKPVDDVVEVASIARGLRAEGEWPAVLELARSKDLKMILSNATEAGYELFPEDAPDDVPPKAFPAKLVRVLKERFDAGLPGLTILPCELFERNAERLLTLAAGQAAAWNLEPDFVDWMKRDCRWLSSLVDRIVSGTPASHPLLERDPMLIAAEPFALWAIEDDGTAPGLFPHPSIEIVKDVGPYHLRKVRILNGAHTALVCKAVPLGFTTVRAAVTDPALAEWLHGLIFEEIVPVIADRAPGAEAFAEHVLDRFRNPFLEHKLADIAVHHAEKVKVRLLPTIAEHEAKFGRTPARLGALMAS